MLDMTNLEQYNRIFCETFSVEEKELNTDFTYEKIAEWTSIRQLALINELEDTFDLMFDTEDIIGLNSYEKGKEIMRKNGIEL